MSGQGEKGTLYNPGPGGMYSLIFWILRLAVIALVCFVVVKNIEPYSIWSQNWFGDMEPAWVQWVPGAGFVATMAYRFTGIVIWIILQIFECIPIFLLGNRFGLGVLIASYEQQSQQQRQIESYATDDAVLKFLKRKYNRLGLKSLDFFRMAAPFAYIVDIILVTTIFPPIREGYTLGQVTSAWDFSGVAWGNLVSIAVTVFAFEVAVMVWLRTSEMLFLIRRGIANNG